MRLLLDSHVLLWYVDQDQNLSEFAHAVVTDPDNDLMISAGTVWELSIKLSLNKLSLSSPFVIWMSQAIADLGANLLPITVEHAAVQAELPSHHRDPFDRLLIAQSIVESIPLVSGDETFDRYGVSRLW